MKYNDIIKDLLNVVGLLEYTDDEPTEAVLFTGVRHNEFADYLLDNAGLKKADNLTKEVVLVVTKDKSTNTAKVNTAKERGIPIMTLDEAMKYYGFQE